MRSADFRASLPVTPLRQHVVGLHSICNTLVDGLAATGHEVDNFMPAVEHHLRQIAVHTSTPDWVHDGIRRKVLDEFTTALAQITAVDPNDPRRLT